MEIGHDVLEIVERIKPLLAGKEPQTQSAVLAELLSLWVCGLNVLNDRAETQKLREWALEAHFELVGELIAINEKLYATRK